MRRVGFGFGCAVMLRIAAGHDHRAAFGAVCAGVVQIDGLADACEAVGRRFESPVAGAMRACAEQDQRGPSVHGRVFDWRHACLRPRDERRGQPACREQPEKCAGNDHDRASLLAPEHEGDKEKRK